MASIKKRLERLEGGRQRGIPIIIMKPGETKEQATQRHLAEHPQDKDAEAVILIRSPSPKDSPARSG